MPYIIHNSCPKKEYCCCIYLSIKYYTTQICLMYYYVRELIFMVLKILNSLDFFKVSQFYYNSLDLIKLKPVLMFKYMVFTEI